jgi:outer membrane immunogenic protein
MKKLSVTKLVLLASVSPTALVFADTANAADLPLKAAMAAPVPAYSWTGCYAGAHVGWGWGQQHPTDGFRGGTSGPGASAKGSLDSSGGLFGGQVGCNYQFAGNWVVGLQGDLAGTDINGKGADPFFGRKGSTVALKTDWLASVTGRVGLTSSDNLALYYVKGGVAWDHNQWDLSNTGFTGPSLWSETRTGWTIGAGIEWVLWSPRWTGFAEFNYYNFGNGTTFTGADLSFFQTGQQSIETVKVGINYKLTGP